MTPLEAILIAVGGIHLAVTLVLLAALFHAHKKLRASQAALAMLAQRYMSTQHPHLVPLSGGGNEIN